MLITPGLPYVAVENLKLQYRVHCFINFRGHDKVGAGVKKISLRHLAQKNCC